MKNSNKVPTTVKLNSGLYDELKILSIRHKFTFQSFVEKCVFLYIDQIPFREIVNNFQLPILSSTGSI